MEYDNYLMHHGTKGQRWGYRHFQFPDGTWTELGKARRRAMSGAGEAARRVKKAVKKTAKVTSATIKRTRKAIKNASDNARTRKEAKAAKKEAKIQKRVEKAIRKNDINTILKYTSHMTNDQLKDASARAGWIAALTKNRPEKKKSLAMKAATTIGKYAVDKSRDLAKKGVDAAKNNSKPKNQDKMAKEIDRLFEAAAIYDKYGAIPRKKKAKSGSVQDRLNKLYGWY